MKNNNFFPLKEREINMRGQDSSNDIAVKEMSKDLCNLLGISSIKTVGFMRLLKDYMVHKIAEQALDCESGQLKETSMEVPFLGKINIKIENKKLIYSFEMEDGLQKEIKNAITKGKSPMVESAEDALVRMLKERYNSLI